MITDETPTTRKLPTGSVMSRFGPEQPTSFSDFAPLPPELNNMMEQFAKVEYPIDSKMDLLRKLGGHEAPLFVGEMAVEAGSAVMFLPASVFPVATPANFAEKLCELYRQRSAIRPTEAVPPEEAKELATRFVSENAKMVQLAAKLLRWIAEEKSQTIDKDSDAFAARLMREHGRLFEEIADAFVDIGVLRSKAKEAVRERQEGRPVA